MEHISGIFRAPVLILDGERVIIASSEPDLSGRRFDASRARKLSPAIHVGFYYRDQPCEVVVGELQRGEQISKRLAQVLVEMIVDEVTAPNLAPARNELKNKFIYDLLHCHIDDEETILHYAELLRLDLTPPRSVILIDAADYILGEAEGDNGTGRQAQRRAQFIIDTVIRFFHLPNDLICAYLGNGRVGVLKASDSQNLADWSEMQTPSTGWADLDALKRASDALLDRLPICTRQIHIGLGRHHPGIKGLAKSYTDAQVALSLGRRFNEEKRIYCLDELGMAAFVGISHEQTKVELAEHLLSPLIGEPELLHTLKIFFAEDCAVSAAANRLFIHRNTLGYRLDKVAHLTGLDPRHFDDAIQIRLALLLCTLYEQ
ncbi:MAG TPA: helix-turn-helix domain-containing protein [Candidatus Binatia bacterium]|nr:helix-turn-helix domain-containing protein [Candidatus Binatia bacterium]